MTCGIILNILINRQCVEEMKLFWDFPWKFLFIFNLKQVLSTNFIKGENFESKN